MMNTNNAIAPCARESGYISDVHSSVKKKIKSTTQHAWTWLGSMEPYRWQRQDFEDEASDITAAATSTTTTSSCYTHGNLHESQRPEPPQHTHLLLADAGLLEPALSDRRSAEDEVQGGLPAR